MYTLINGSPKIQKSNSLYFLNIIKTKLNDFNLVEIKNNSYQEIFNSIKKSDVIVLAFPLYVDSPSSITLSFLDYLIDNKLSLENKLVYVIVNCGFRESKHNITAINIIKSFCKKLGAIYSGGILIGAGEIVGKEKYKFISSKVLKKLNYFSFMIKHKRKVMDIMVSADILNNKLFCLIGNLFWNKASSKNRLMLNDLREK